MIVRVQTRVIVKTIIDYHQLSLPFERAFNLWCNILEDLPGSIKFPTNIRPINLTIMAGGSKALSPSAFYLIGRQWLADIIILFLLVNSNLSINCKLNNNFFRIFQRVTRTLWNTPNLDPAVLSRVLFKFVKGFNWFVVSRSSAFRIVFSLNRSDIPFS